jgi:hypothetical protein
VVYVVLSLLAADIAASGNAPTQASGKGALAEVARQPAGPVALGVLAAGLLAYAIWRLSETFRPDHTGEITLWNRVGSLAAALVYLALWAEAISIIAGRRTSGGPSNHPVPYVASVLRWPGGPGWVGLAGAAVAIGGIVLVVWGLTHDYGQELTAHPLGHRGRLAAQVTGAFGNLTRGLLVVLIGVYLLVGAVTDDPDKAKSLDAVMFTIAHRPLGPLMLGIAALGLFSFALFSLIEVRYRRL